MSIRSWSLALAAGLLALACANPVPSSTGGVRCLDIQDSSVASVEDQAFLSALRARCTAQADAARWDYGDLDLLLAGVGWAVGDQRLSAPERAALQDLMDQMADLSGSCRGRTSLPRDPPPTSEIQADTLNACGVLQLQVQAQTADPEGTPISVTPSAGLGGVEDCAAQGTSAHTWRIWPVQGVEQEILVRPGVEEPVHLPLRVPPAPIEATVADGTMTVRLLAQGCAPADLGLAINPGDNTWVKVWPFVAEEPVQVKLATPGLVVVNLTNPLGGDLSTRRYTWDGGGGLVARDGG